METKCIEMIKDLGDVLPHFLEPAFESELNWWNMELTNVQKQKMLLEVKKFGLDKTLTFGVYINVNFCVYCLCLLFFYYDYESVFIL